MCGFPLLLSCCPPIHPKRLPTILGAHREWEGKGTEFRALNFLIHPNVRAAATHVPMSGIMDFMLKLKLSQAAGRIEHSPAPSPLATVAVFRGHSPSLCPGVCQ